MIWHHTDQSTKSIFRELAKENSERRQFAESALVKAASARFYIKPVIEVLEIPDTSVDVKPSANHFYAYDRDDRFCNTDDSKSHFEIKLGGISPNDALTCSTDWTPLPFNKFEEMNIIEFNDMLSNFDWN